MVPQGTRFGPYEVVDLLGSGGMGEVYRGRDPRLGRPVAIKILHTSSADVDRLKRFEAEARAVGAIGHPHILVVHDVGNAAGQPYLVTELLEGETLRARLAHGPLPVSKAVELGLQMAYGLAAAHEKGVVHRDIKPENLFVTRDGLLKILDFGLAKLTEPASSDAPTYAGDMLTAPGITMGTVGYMPPEQVRGVAVDHRADIFAAGAVLHEMLSGERAFRRETAAETLTAILHEDPAELPPSVPPAIARLTSRCLEKRPEERFQSARDLAFALEAISGVSGAVSLTPPSQIPRRRVLVLGAAALGLGAMGGGTGAFLAWKGAPRPVPSYRRLTFRRGLVRSARFGPDLHTVFYSALWDGDSCRVYTVRPESSESRPLDLPNANLLAVSRSGEMAIALGTHIEGIMTYGTLARVPAGGAPRELLEEVRFADWSARSPDLAVVRRADRRDQVEYPIGRVLTRAAERSPGFSFARVSPGGDRVAYIHYTSGGLRGLVAVVDGAGTTRDVTGEFFNVHGLAWLRDEIWFTAADERPMFRALHAVDARGVVRLVARVPGNTSLHDSAPDGRLLLAHTDDREGIVVKPSGDHAERDLSWLDLSSVADLSRDGTTILFTEFGQGGGERYSTYLRRTDGAPAVRLGDGTALALSPDGKWAACLLPSTPTSLALVPTGAGEVKRLDTGSLTLSGAARFTPDGHRLVVSATQPGRPPRIFSIPLNGGQPRPLTPEGTTFRALAPDGQLLVARNTGTGELYMYPLDGGSSRLLSGVQPRETVVGWITRGVLVAGAGESDHTFSRIDTLDPATGRRTLWNRLFPPDRAGVMFMTGLQVTPDGRGYAYTWHRALSDLYLAQGF